jgi:heptosyltransferase-2
MRPLPEPPFHAALLAPTWLGDSVMSTALLAPLAALSGHPVQVWARPAFRTLFAGLASVSRVLPFDPKGRHRGWRGLRRWRRDVAAAGIPEAVWILPESFSAALAARISGTPLRLGWAGQGRNWLLSHAPAFPGRRHQRHWIVEQAQLLPPPARAAEDQPALQPELPLRANQRDAALALLAELDLEPARCCALVPGATYGPAKRWPGFSELAARLPAELTPLLIGGPGDRSVLDALGQSLRERGRVHHDLGGRLELMELAALLREVRFTVSNDTGPMHLAAAAGGRVLGLFASTSPAWTAPVGPAARVLSSHVPCSPCLERHCPLREMICMDALGVERVLDALGDWIREAAA